MKIQVNTLTDTERAIYNAGRRSERNRIVKMIVSRAQGSVIDDCDEGSHLTFASVMSDYWHNGRMCLCEFRKLIGVTKTMKGKK